MTVSTPAALASQKIYGLGYGRGELEAHVIQTLRDWIVAYIADYERQQGMPPRTLPVPPTPESIHGGVDYESFRGELFPELIVVVQPTSPTERLDPGQYATWYTVDVAAIVTVEGDQDQTRALADAYGTALQKLVPQQGAFGTSPDGTEPFATRTRLEDAYALAFPDETVRDIMRATVMARTFIEHLVDDFAGPRTPPQDPYASPLPPFVATEVEVALIRGTPDTSGWVDADAVLLDGNVVPPVVRYEEVTVDEPADQNPD